MTPGPPGAPPDTPVPAPSPIDIVYADDSLLVLNKPPGLLCVPGRGEDKQDCLSRRVQARHPEALIVHRLDMATSGLLLMARSLSMQRALSRLFEQREVRKRYVAVVAGRLAPADAPDGWGLIDLPIAPDWPRRPLRVIDAAGGKPSQTHWRALAFDAASDSTRVELAPLTGRSHQLRVHLQALGHPIWGDALYAPPAVQAQSPRLLLHACQLEFAHPASGDWLRLHSPAEF